MKKIIFKIIIVSLLTLIIGCNNDEDKKTRKPEEKIYVIDITKENAPFTHIFAYNRGYVIYANINKDGIPKNAIVKSGKVFFVLVFRENGKPYQSFYNNTIYIFDNICNNEIDIATIKDYMLDYSGYTFDNQYSNFETTESLDILGPNISNEIEKKIAKIRINYGAKFIGNTIGIINDTLYFPELIYLLGLAYTLIEYNGDYEDAIGIGYESKAAHHILSIIQYTNPEEEPTTLANYVVSNFSLLTSTLQLADKRQKQIKIAEEMLKEKNNNSIQNITK
ncbi:hypothetical protein [Odoribacter laneus]|uniref:Uncharacterized protein n=1 Tax=Odoribacter laneus YIT 12061 TaxID=742817 RepID=H1DIQ0_9BACT|nr:hypothetical protein [Odoribacter laneus]EHP46662.1 hypothetical protein HMPREF9449_02279 [Odoribacter laneus YIT 12061]